jgi:ubiquinone/menaquinone biosynthesis C-methylase UbiE
MNFYAEISPYYDKITSGGYYNYKKISNDYSKLIKGKNILEIGIGTGTLANLLKKKGFRIVGIDISKPMLKIAKRKLKDTNIKLINKNILNFRSKSKFDSIISQASVFVVINSKEGKVVESYLSKKQDIKMAARNIFQLLDEKGRFIFDFYPEHNTKNRFFAFGEYRYEFEIIKHRGMQDFTKVHHIKKGDRIIAVSKIHKIRISLKEFKELARNVGFHRIKIIRDKYVILQK